MEIEMKPERDDEIENRTLLEETFYVLTKKNCVFRVRLTKTGLRLIKESENNIKEQIIPINEIIGCRCLRSRKQSKNCACQSITRSGNLKVVEENSGDLDDSDISAYLYIYAYILVSGKGHTKKRERTIITLRFRSFDKYEDNNKEAQKWRTIIKKLIKGDAITPSHIADFSIANKYKEERKLLVLCNPKSGPGKAKLIFQDKIVPILQEAEIPFDLHITKHANFARDFIRTSNIYQWSGVLLVGGDGIVFEAINGLFERWDWSEALKAIPLGIVPGGSGNGLARSIAHHSGEPYMPSPALPAALAAVKQASTRMDIIRVETTSQILFSFLSVGWGFLSDVDIESERFRLLGGQRFTVWSVARLIGLKSYGGKLWYSPANVPLACVERTEAVMTSTLDLPTELETEGVQRQRVDSWYSAASRRSAYFSATGSSYQSTTDSGLGGGEGAPNADGEKPQMYGPASQLPCLRAPAPSTWKCVEGRFLMVHASYQSHLGEDAFFAPDAKLNDGTIWLLIVHGRATRGQLLQFLLGLSSGAHGAMTREEGAPIELIPVNAFRIEPDMSEHGYITVDGEHVEYGPIQAEVFPELVRMMVP